jgi:hypothetical protein
LNISPLRITAIARDLGDVEGNKFTFLLEMENWADTDAAGLCIALTNHLPDGVTPEFSGASMDANGRPLGATDDANYQPADGRPGTKVARAGTGWGVALQSTSQVTWLNSSGGGNTVPPIDLLAEANACVPVNPGDCDPCWTSMCALIPGGCTSFPKPQAADEERLDNAGGTLDPAPDNTLDGFQFDVDNFDNAETLSFNWFLIHDGTPGPPVQREPIGVSGTGSGFGYGVLNIYRRGAIGGPGLWSRNPGSPEGPGSNIGTAQDTFLMFVTSTENTPSTYTVTFEAEVGIAMTAPYFFFGDNSCTGVSANTNSIPTPQTSVDLTGFSATQDARTGRINLNWQTAGEVDNVGFFVYSAVPDATGRSFTVGEVLNNRIIPAKGSETQGADYMFADTRTVSGKETRGYFLEDVDVNGTGTFHGPYFIKVNSVIGTSESVRPSLGSRRTLR